MLLSTPGMLILWLYMVGSVQSEAFSSTANLIQLVKSEPGLVVNLEAYIQEEESRLTEIKRYIDEIRSKNSSGSSDALSYAGHPVNAYNLIKRWHKLSSMTPDTPSHQAILSKLTDLSLPSQDDFVGAGAALLRLQRTFDLNTDDIATGKIYNDGGAAPLAADDFREIGRIALKNSDFGLAAQWLEKILQQPSDELPDIETFLDLAEAFKGIGDFDKATAYTKIAADINPEDTNLDQAYHKLRILAAQKRSAEPSANTNPVSPTTWKRYLPTWKIEYEKLCRGEKDALQDPSYAKNLVCRYKPGNLPYVVYKEEILSWDPRIGMFYDVISDKQAEMIKTKAYPKLFRGKIGKPDDPSDSDIRVSKVAWLWDEDPEILPLSLKVEDVTGLETEYRNPLSSSEPFQVVNYGIGGQYEPHVDFYENKEHLNHVPDFILNTGDRIATFLFYLTDVKHGGATVFPRLNIRVPPTKNGAAFWYNAKLSGRFDERTEHAGCPVLLGEKWVSNKWIREFGQEFKRKCGLSLNAIDDS